MTQRLLKIKLAAVLLCAWAASGLHAAEVTVAVAAHFSAPMQAIAKAFAQDTGHTAHLAFGATGKFYAQIKNGAPFGVLLSADQQTPVRLELEGLAVANTRQTYATGRLVLWHSRSGVVVDEALLRTLALPAQDTERNARLAQLFPLAPRSSGGAPLKVSHFKIAIADPTTAPYGAAAQALMQRLGVWAALQPQLVQGESIGQAFQFVSTGNAQLGFVALSQLRAMTLGTPDARATNTNTTDSVALRQSTLPPELLGTPGSAWLVPPHLHSSLKHDAVLLKAGQHNAAAKALLAYLQSPRAQTIIRAYGYSL